MPTCQALNRCQWSNRRPRLALQWIATSRRPQADRHTNNINHCTVHDLGAHWGVSAVYTWVGVTLLWVAIMIERSGAKRNCGKGRNMDCILRFLFWSTLVVLWCMALEKELSSEVGLLVR